MSYQKCLQSSSILYLSTIRWLVVWFSVSIIVIFSGSSSQINPGLSFSSLSFLDPLKSIINVIRRASQSFNNSACLFNLQMFCSLRLFQKGWINFIKYVIGLFWPLIISVLIIYKVRAISNLSNCSLLLPLCSCASNIFQWKGPRNCSFGCEYSIASWTRYAQLNLYLEHASLNFFLLMTRVKIQSR